MICKVIIAVQFFISEKLKSKKRMGQKITKFNRLIIVKVYTNIALKAFNAFSVIILAPIYHYFLF